MLQAATSPALLPRLAELKPSRPHWPMGWIALLAALLSGAIGIELALHHPLSATWALGLWVATALAAVLLWVKTPVLVLGPLAVCGLAPLTGWITFEELDLLVTAAACGGNLAYALQMHAHDRAPAWRHALDYSGPIKLLIAGIAAATLMGAWRGVQDAGGWQFGWFQGYHEPMNALRNSKALFLVLLLLPLWTEAGRARPRSFSRGVLLALLIALAGGSAAALWERASYTGLLDFSSDYRSTALFWEMHVGGAALDGFLVMTLPFAALALLRTRSPWRFGLGLLLVLMAAYASLTTFSRGVYLALPLSLIPMVLLADAQRRRAQATPLESTHPMELAVSAPLPHLGKIGALAMAAAFALSSVLVFSGGGYRGMLALFGVLLVLLTMPASLWLPTLGQRITALVMGGLLAAVLGGATWALSLAVPKAAYVLYALALAVCGLLRWRDRPGVAQPVYTMLVSGAWFWLLIGMVSVADYWGGTQGRWASLAALLALGGLWCAQLVDQRLWPLQSSGREGLRQRALLVSGLVLVMGVVALFGGGAYLRDRISTWKEDGHTRINHWREGLRLLHGPEEWLLGKGAGRFVATNLYQGPSQAMVGDYRLRREPVGQDTETFLALSGGRHQLGYGEVFRVMQRIDPPPPGKLKLRVIARSPTGGKLRAELCERQLIYIANCTEAYAAIQSEATPEAAGNAPAPSPTSATAWRTYELELSPPRGMGGEWPWRRFVVFAMAVETPGARIDIARVDLRDDADRPLLENADFNREMARWFFSSDRHHLPWHMKNVALHVLFEQGLLGLGLLSAAFVVALLRLSFGRGRDHPLAPAIVAALIGFAVVGAFDSLIDSARIGFLFFTLLLLGLGLRALPGEGAQRVA